ncbi:MAG: hypothetical protein J6P74_07065 [Paludibacteraceae bacterium]|nr:hypothetical protein [Paludibacteraceae bacterium]
MKTLRYLLIICTLTMAAAMSGQPQFKNSQNQEAFSTQQVKTTHHAAYTYTTATLMESGSSLPMAAKNGLTIGANTPDDNSSLSLMPRPRRVGEDGGFEDEGEDSEDLPGEPNPVGDGVWVLLILAAGYAWYRKWREWRKMTCLQSMKAKCTMYAKCTK